MYCLEQTLYSGREWQRDSPPPERRPLPHRHLYQALRTAPIYVRSIHVSSGDALDIRVLCREWDRHISEDEAQKQYQRTQMVEQEFGEAFTGRKRIFTFVLFPPFLIPSFL